MTLEKGTPNIFPTRAGALIATWELWKLRNDKVFQRRNPSLSLWLSNFKS